MSVVFYTENLYVCVYYLIHVLVSLYTLTDPWNICMYVCNDVFLQWMSTFPALMWHRKAADILFPWVDLVSEEILDLKVWQSSFLINGS